MRQSGDLIVNAPLDRKLVKLLLSLGDADVSTLTCDNMSEGRVGVIEATADERTGNILGAVKCEIGSDVAEWTDMIETGF